MTAKVEPSDPRVEYASRETKYRKMASHRRRQQYRLGNLRMVVFLAAVVMLGLVVAQRIHPAWIAAPLAVFGGLGLAFDIMERRRVDGERRAAFSARGLARLDGTWAGTGPSGTDFADPQHPYADDLDLFGEGSLFQYLCVARTTQGQAALADWLMAPAGLASVGLRHGAVKELTPMLDFREDLAVLGEDVGSQVAGPTLLEWSARREPGLTPMARWVAVTLAVVSTVSVIGWLMGLAAWIPLAALTCQMVFAQRYRTIVRRTLTELAAPAHALDVLVALLKRLERERFTDPLLRQQAGALETDGYPPSRVIADLQRLVRWIDSRKNPFAVPFFGLTLATTQLAMAVESWRRKYGASIPGWVRAVGDIEALSSLAARAFDHPQDVFPTVGDQRPGLTATGLGHPLLPESGCIRNDIELNGDAPVWIVSGSNMSGKSTLLRALGVNVALALAGGTVTATGMTLSRLQVVASIRIRDSLRDGRSRFYAEILRLRQMTELASREPVLFLIDELLHGTNSHDRRIGAEAVINGLMARQAMGLITTHDLALTKLDGGHPYRLRNVHLRDHLEDGEMVFDYRLHPGVIRHSNALALMRKIGLEVEVSPANPGETPT